MGPHGPMWAHMRPYKRNCCHMDPFGHKWVHIWFMWAHMRPYVRIWNARSPAAGHVPNRGCLRHLDPLTRKYVDKHNTHNKHIFHTAIHKNVSSLGYDPFAGPALDIQRGRIKHPSTPFGSPVVLRRINICICCMIYKPFIFFPLFTLAHSSLTLYNASCMPGPILNTPVPEMAHTPRQLWHTEGPPVRESSPPQA